MRFRMWFGLFSATCVEVMEEPHIHLAPRMREEVGRASPPGEGR